MRWWCCAPAPRWRWTQLQAHCRTLIAGYKCPRSVEFRDTLPLSAAGKVLKVDLRAPFWAGKSRNVN